MVKRLLALQLSSIIMAAIAMISFVTIYSLLDSFNWVNHTHEVIYQIHKIKDDIADCQTSVREAVFADNRSYLNNYLEKSPTIESEIDNLQWLARDNEVQQNNIYNLRLNLNRRISLFREIIELYNQRKVNESRNLAMIKFGEPWVISTRNLVDIIENEELKLLEVRINDYKKKSNLVLYGIPLLMISYIVIFNTATQLLAFKVQIT